MNCRRVFVYAARITQTTDLITERHLQICLFGDEHVEICC